MMMSALFKFVSLVGLASIVNGCNDPDSGIRTGACDPYCTGGNRRQDITGHVDIGGCPLSFCCTRIDLPKPVCPPCNSGCNENFIGDDDCITYEDYLGMLFP